MSETQLPSLRRTLPMGRPARPNSQQFGTRLRSETQKRERRRRDPRMGWGERGQVSASCGGGGWGGKFGGGRLKNLKGLGIGGKQRKEGTCRRKGLKCAKVGRWECG